MHDDYPDETWGGVSDEEIMLRREASLQPEPRFIPSAELSTILDIEVDHEQLVEHLVEIYRVLWPDEDPDAEPEYDAIARIAETFTARGYGR